MDSLEIKWPGWETVRLIGRGSFGAVYEIQRDVFGHQEKAALKVITIPQNSGDIEELYNDGYDEESITKRFQGYLKEIVREYSLMAEMKGHSNVVDCDDLRYVQHDDGLGWDVFIKMELLTPLTKALPKTISDEQVIKIGIDMCNALILCRDRNIVHRDIKPQNIFVSKDGNYKLGDFGIAKITEHTTSGTKTGTYKYMAPEVYNGQPYGPSTDIYSLGLVLYWLLNERRTPFLSLPPQVPTSVEEEDARKRRFSGVRIPAPAHGSKTLKNIVLKACAFNPKDRFADAAEMKRALADLSVETVIEETEPETVTDGNTWICPNDETVNSGNQCRICGYKRPTRNPQRFMWLWLAITVGIVVCLISVWLIAGNQLNWGFRQINSAESAESNPSEKNAYAEAEKLLKKGDKASAAILFGKLGDYRDARSHSLKLWREVTNHNIIVADSMFMIGLNSDGTVIMTKNANDVYTEANNWRNLISIAANEGSMVGLHSDGTVSGAGRDMSFSNGRMADSVKHLKDIVAVDISMNTLAVLKSDGTVTVSGSNDEGQCDVYGWKDIVAISTGSFHTLGLRKDGTVVAVGNNDYGQCNVSGWKDIVGICADDTHSVGLKADGTVVAVGSNEDGQCDVNEWTGIVSLTAGGNRTIGITKDRGLVLAGRPGETVSEVDMLYGPDWTNLEAVSTSGFTIMGVRKDGTVVADGLYYFCNQESVEDWVDIRIPST